MAGFAIDWQSRASLANPVLVQSRMLTLPTVLERADRSVHPDSSCPRIKLHYLGRRVNRPRLLEWR